MKASEVLTKALSLIDEPDKWTQGVDHGKKCVQPAGYGSGRYIDCYCARGAVRHVGWNEPAPRNRALGYLQQAIPASVPHWTTRTVTGYNDHFPQTAHSGVVRWFKRAIAKAKKAKD